MPRPKTRRGQLSLILPTKLEDRVERFRAKLEKEQQGIRLSTSDAVRRLLELALEEHA